jgi:hypothetical protein
MRCIWCLDERPPGNEHVFQLAIGGTLRLDRVCDTGPPGVSPCNAKLGNIADAPLVDHELILMRRSELGLAGNSGKVPDAALALLGKGGCWQVITRSKFASFPTKQASLSQG